MNSTYKQQYLKYKHKYKTLKKNLEHGYPIKYKELNGNKFTDIYPNDPEDIYHVSHPAITFFRTDDDKIVKFYNEPTKNLDKYETTSNIQKPDKNKILVINNIKVFDEFTNKYGAITKKDDTFIIQNSHINWGDELVAKSGEFIFIKWYDVANDYKGFYLEQPISIKKKESIGKTYYYKDDISPEKAKKLKYNRYKWAPFHKRDYISWWSWEYNYSGILIFV